jgi:hypothetical protein
VRRLLSLPLLALSSALLDGADLDPATAAAFDRYAKLTEQELQKPPGPHDFLWIDRHPKEQSLAWLGQPIIAAGQTLDQGHEIEIPDATFQHWIGTYLLEYATLERARDFILGYGDYKYFFKDFFIDSRLVKRDGDRFDAFLRLSRKRFATVILNMNVTANYTAIDANHAYIICHATHIGEVEHVRQKKNYDQERPASDEYGYLWRHNVYWRILQTGDGVFVEVQSLTLSRKAGTLSPGRLLNGFIEDFPREFVAGMLDDVRKAFPRPAK